MNLSFDIEYHVVPDGNVGILQLSIKTEVHLPLEGSALAAQEVVVEVARRLSGKDESFVRERLTEQFWLRDGDRPEEPST